MAKARLSKHQLLTLMAIWNIQNGHDEQIVASMRVLYRALSWDLHPAPGFVQKWIVRRAVSQLLTKGCIARDYRDSKAHYTLTQAGQNFVRPSSAPKHRP